MSFDRLAGFVAIRQTQREDEVLAQLIRHVVSLETIKLSGASELATYLDEHYGLRFTPLRIQAAVDKLLSSKDLSRELNGNYSLPLAQKAALLKRVEEARDLESRVREKWLDSATKKFPELERDQAWRALEAYLSRMFRQHGIQTMALIDPSIEIPEEYQAGLRAMLNDALTSCCEMVQRKPVETCISDFLIDIPNDADRIAFIVRLADCTVSYFSLTVPPEVALELRSQLKPLTLFFDTNVLFGLVGLGDGPLKDVPDELVTLVRETPLPFRMRYHSSTEKELRDTFDAVVGRLRGMAWSPAVSRVAATSHRVASIQRLYHQRNAEHPITPDSFFKPYQHIDVLVQDRGLSLYRDATSVERQRVYDLIADFQKFIQRMGRERNYDAIDHDMTVLDCVRRLRSKANSSLQAEALLVTTDFVLWRFDRSQSRRSGSLPTVVLPNQLLQLLRPFITNTPDFDRSFAESFTLPEFRALGDGSQAAVGRLLEIVASFGDLPETTVSALLSNDLFLDGLGNKRETELRQYVESAIAIQNELLAEERSRLSAELAQEREQRDIIISSRTAELATEFGRRLNAAVEEAENKRREAEQVAAALTTEEARARLAAEERAKGAEGRLALIEAARAEESRERETRRKRNRLIEGIVIGVLLDVAAEWAFQHWQFGWLLMHPNSYGLRVCLFVLLVAGTASLFRRDLWKPLLPLVLIPSILIVPQIVGGPRPNAVERPVGASVPTTPTTRKP